MARYLMSVFGSPEPRPDSPTMTREEKLQSFADTGAFNDKLEREGHFVFADGSRPPSPRPRWTAGATSR